MQGDKNEGVILKKDYKQLKIDFVGKRNIFFIIIGVVFLVGLVSFFVRGFNWDIDFVGGTVTEYNLNKDVSPDDLSDIEKMVTDTLGFAPSSVVRSGNPARQVVIKTRDISSEQRKAIFEALAGVYGMTEDDIYISNNVAPTVGQTLAQNTIIAVGLTVLLMLVYIVFRFEFYSGIAAILCLIFNVFVMLTFYSLSQIPMNMTVIAAFLTILGYSINTTIIIFDRIREDMKQKKGSGAQFKDVVNEGTNRTFARSVNTTITTLMTIICVYILGVPSIKAFVMPLIVGILAGLFSSVCLSGPLWDLIRPKNLKINKKDK
ncbi:MAG: protein translocase subunit SecF [Oscillospiraceae bacterium]|nr:protein translocase subunit SecF [Oscillospiraceae bacterium]